MSQAPSMPMYWDAYLADTTHLSTEEHGAYLLLLAAMWRRNGIVPDDDKDNARIVGLTTAKWRKIKARLNGLICIADDHITQKKLQKTWEKTQEKIEKNRANGAKGGLSKSNNNKDLSQANATISLKRKASIPEPEPEPVKRVTNVTTSKAPVGFEVWWLEVPRKVGKAKALKAYSSALKKTSAEVLLSSIKTYANSRHGEEARFTKHPSSWLNEERWTDEAPQPNFSTEGSTNELTRNNQRQGRRAQGQQSGFEIALERAAAKERLRAEGDQEAVFAGEDHSPCANASKPLFRSEHGRGGSSGGFRGLDGRVVELAAVRG